MKKLLIAAFVLSATSANAHAGLTQSTATQGSSFQTNIRISHGCEGQPTLRVRVAIPEGFISVKPQLKAGWTIKTTRSAYENTYQLHGTDVTEGVTEILWEGELPDDFYDEFPIRGTVTDHLAVDQVVYLPVVQECADGSHEWTQIPAEGQTSSDLDAPAPSFTVTAPTGHSH